MTDKLPIEPGEGEASKPPGLLPLEGTPLAQARQEYETEGSEYFLRKVFETNPQKGCELLFRLYYQALCMHAVRYVYSKEIAEDLVSDIFLNFWKTQAYQNVSSSYRAYLFRAVRNRAYNYLSSELKRVDPLENAGAAESSGADLPEQMMHCEELHHRIDQLVSTLPPQCRKVFLLNRFEGKKNKDIAEDLNISIRTVETHLQKALNTLRTGLKDLLG